MKRIYLLILVLFSVLNANSCKYYEDQMVYYSNKLDRLTKSTPNDYCNLADNAELLVNNIGGAINSCSDGYKLKSMLKGYSDFLIVTSMKCKK